MTRPYLLTVSEPWDFQGSIGDNTIRGTVHTILSPQIVVFVADNTEVFGDYSGRTLLLKARYVGEGLIVEDSVIGTVGGALLPANYEDIVTENLEDIATYVLVGSIAPVDHSPDNS